MSRLIYDLVKKEEKLRDEGPTLVPVSRDWGENDLKKGMQEASKEESARGSKL